MEQVRSKDGVPIAFERSGKGPPLVLVHGATADHTRWLPVLPEMEKHFTVYAVDRRGRGKSGDAEPYTIDREYEDVAAIVDSIPGPVNLLGHSYGAICSLEASLKTSNLGKLILYEPPIHTDAEEKQSSITIDRINLCLRNEQREKALLIFLQEIVGIPPEEISILRSLPSWPPRVAAAHTIVREEKSIRSYIFYPQRFSHMEIPTLLLLGGDSPPFYHAAIEALRGAIPNNRVRIMPGQRHAAMDTAPGLFLSEVIECVTERKE